MTSWPIDQYTQHMNITYCCHHYGNDETNVISVCLHDDVIKWKHFPRNLPFVRGTPRSPVNSPHKGQWRGALMFSLINDWVNNREAGDLRRYGAHYDVSVMYIIINERCLYYCPIFIIKKHIKIQSNISWFFLYTRRFARFRITASTISNDAIRSMMVLQHRNMDETYLTFLSSLWLLMGHKLWLSTVGC